MQCDAYHGEYVSIGDHISQASCEGAEGTWTTESNDFRGALDDQSIIFVSLKESVVEYGDEGRQANCAVEEVAKGEVEK